MKPSFRPTLLSRSLTRPFPSRRSHSTNTPNAAKANATTSSVSPSEVSHFTSLANSWWDPMGSSRVLHLMNPLRHDFIASCLSTSHPNPTTNKPNTNTNPLHYLDIGCGGGIFAESLARTIPCNPSPDHTPTQAATITAIDPTPDLIQIAREHARTDPKIAAHMRTGRFRYVNCSLEDVLAGSLSGHEPSPTLAESREKEGRKEQQQEEEEGGGGGGGGGGGDQGRQFDVVTLFEVLEHIDATSGSGSSPLTFLTNCLRVVKPGGWLVGSTIARSLPSFLVNQVIAEAPWPIGVVPRGTHEWSKFVNPDELEGWLQEGLMRGRDGQVTRAGSEALQGMEWKCAGVMYFPGLGWKFVGGSENWGNYFWAVRKGV